MIRLLSAPKHRPARVVITWAALAAFCAQMWHVPELLAQESNARAQLSARLAAEREQRIGVRSDLPPGRRHAELARHADRVARDAWLAGAAGRDPEQALGDLSELEQRLRGAQLDLQGRIVGARARLTARGAGPRVLERLDRFEAASAERYAETFRRLSLVRAARTDPQRLQSQLEGLADFLNSDHGSRPEAPTPAPRKLPRRALARAESRTAAPVLGYPAPLPAPSDVLWPGLADVAAQAVTGAPAAADLAPAAPEIAFPALTSGVTACNYDQQLPVGNPLRTAADADPVVRQARALGCDPVKLFEFVRNKCTYEPYFGSVKPAAATLEQRTGNDLDLAVLLVSLLRASGVPARLAYGTIEVPAPLACRWLGVEDPIQAARVFERNGVPFECDYDRGVPQTLRLDHVWVKAHVDGFPYRGELPPVSGVAGDTWTELDPSFKQHSFTATDLEHQVPIDPGSLLINLRTGAQVAPDHATGLRQDLIVTQMRALAEPIRNLLAARSLVAETVFRQRRVSEELLGLFPVTDNYRIAKRGLSLRSVPDRLRHRATVTLRRADGTEILSHALPLASLGDKRVVLSYAAAPGFEEAVEEAQQPDGEFEAFYVEVQPALHVGGAQVAWSDLAGEPIGMAERQTLDVTFEAPNWPSETATDEFLAGGVHALVFSQAPVTAETLARNTDALASAGAALESPGTGVEQVLGPVLHAIGISYFHQADRFNQITAGNLGVVVTRHPSALRVAWDIHAADVLMDGALPVEVAADRVRTDVLRDVTVAVGLRVPTPGAFSPEQQFAFTSALTSSSLEGNTILQTLDGDAAASPVEAIERANQGGAAGIYTVASVAAANALLGPGGALADLPLRLRTAVRDGAAAGYELTVIEATTPGVAIGGEEYLALIKRDQLTSSSDFLLYNVASRRTASAEALTQRLFASTPLALRPRPAELLRYEPPDPGAPDPYDGSRYGAPLRRAREWTRVVQSATTNAGLWYLPAIIDINAWHRSRTGTDPVTPVAAALAVSAPVSRASEEPGILNVVARSLNPTSADWIAAPGTGPRADASVLRVTGDVTRGAGWRLTVLDPEGEVYQQFPPTGQPDAQTAQLAADIRFATPTPEAADGVYRYRLTASNGVQATPVSGTVRVDRTAPVVRLAGACCPPTGQCSQTIQSQCAGVWRAGETCAAARCGSPQARSGVLKLRGRVSDDNFASVEVRVAAGLRWNGTAYAPVNPAALQPAFVSQSQHGETGDEVFYEFDTTTYSDELRLLVRASDLAGNATEATLVVPDADDLNPLPPDTVQPTATLDAVSGNLALQGREISADDSIRVTVRAQDQRRQTRAPGAALVAGEVKRVEVLATGAGGTRVLRAFALADGQVVDPPAVPYPPVTFTFDLTDKEVARAYQLPLGPQTLQVRVTDAAGNQRIETAEDIAFTVGGGVGNVAVSPRVATPSEPLVSVTASTQSAQNTWSIGVRRQGAPAPVLEFTGNGQAASARFDAETAGPNDEPLEDGDYDVIVTAGANPPVTAAAAFSVDLVQLAPRAEITHIADFRTFDPTDGDQLGTTVPRLTTGFYPLRGTASDPDSRIQYRVLLVDANDPQRGYVFSPHAQERTAGRWSAAPVVGGVAPSVPWAAADGQTFIAGPDGLGVQLAELDLTLVPNGPYDVVLQVESLDAAGAGIPATRVGDSRRVLVDSPLKIGNVAFQQQDLIVPTAGYPITVVRSYNSLDLRDRGTFGPGWDFSVLEMDVTLDDEHLPPPPNYDPLADSDQGVPVRYGGWHQRNVTLTLPDGRRATFAFTLIVDPENPHTDAGDLVLRAKYEAPPGVHAKLETLNVEQVVMLPTLGAQWRTGGPTCPLERYDFEGWVLTTEDGTAYTIRRVPLDDGNGADYDDGTALGVFIPRVWGEPYLDSVSTPGRETIQILRDAEGKPADVEHFAAGSVSGDAPTRKIKIVRDDGVITAIYGPESFQRVDQGGNTTLELRPDAQPAFTYGYTPPAQLPGGATSPRLTTVSRLVSRTPQGAPVYEDTTLEYHDHRDAQGNVVPTHPNHRPFHVKSVKDPRGLAPVTMVYDDAGRMIATRDAHGNEVAFTRDLDLRSETVWDRSSPPRATTYFYDARGNIVKEIDPDQRITSRVFNAQDQLIEELRPGDRKPWKYEYDDRGNRTKETDPADNTTSVVYSQDRSGTLTHMTQTDAAQNVRTTYFDPFGNPIATESGRLRTENQYDPVTNRLTRTSMSEIRSDGSVAPGHTTAEYFYDEDTGDLIRTVHHGHGPGGNPVDDFGHDARGFQVYTSELRLAPAVAGGTPVWKRVTRWTKHDDAGRAVETKRVVTNATGATDPAPDPTAYPPGSPDTATAYNSAGQVVATIDHTRGVAVTRLYNERGDAVESAEWPYESYLVYKAWLANPSGTLAATLPPDPHNPGKKLNPVVSRTVFDGNGRPAYTTDRTEHPAYPTAAPAAGTRTVYDSLGRVFRTERVSGLQVAVAWINGAESLAQTSAPNGDTLPWLSRSTTDYGPGGATDAVSLDFSTDTAANASTRYEYDTAGRRKAMVDALQNRTEFEHDALGRQKLVRDARRKETRYDYDPDGRRTLTEFHDRTTRRTVYNAHGQPEAEFDQMGHERRFVHDHDGRLTRVTFPLTLDAETGTNKQAEYDYDYDARGNLVSVTDARDKVSLYDFDHLGRQVGRTLPEQLNGQTLRESMVYDAADQLDVQTDFEGNRTEFDFVRGLIRERRHYAPGVTPFKRRYVFTHDLLGRLLRVTRYSDGAATPDRELFYAYDATGRLEFFQSPEGTIRYAHDPGTGRHVSTAVFDAGDNPNTDPLSFLLSYRYDKLGRLQFVYVGEPSESNTFRYEYQYNEVGSRKALLYPGNLRTDYDYDDLHRLTSIITKRGSTKLLDCTYDLRDDGRRVGIQDRRWTPTGESRVDLAFDYDAMGRLTLERSTPVSGPTRPDSNYEHTYTYDLVGNRRTKTVRRNGALHHQVAYAYGPNDRLSSETGGPGGTVLYGYDKNGFLTSRTGGLQPNVSYTANPEGRLATATSGARTVTYDYDPDGAQVAALEGTGGRRYLIDRANPTGHAQVIRESSVVNSTSLETILDYALGAEALAQLPGPEVAYAQHRLTDGHGSTRLLLDTAGLSTDTFDYDAFGNLVGRSPADALAVTRLLYAGEWFDGVAGMYNLRSRWYDPAAGRFNSTDPFSGIVAEPQTLHKYAYTLNDPVNNSDPSGMCPPWLLGIHAHRVIGGMYKTTFPANVVTLGATIPGLGGLLLPDILDFTLKEVGEIKPLSAWGAATGAVQLANYLAALNGLTFRTRGGLVLRIPPVAGGGWVTSTWAPTPVLLPIPQCPTVLAFLLGNLGGVIFYTSFPNPRVTLRLAAAAARALAADLAAVLDRFAASLQSASEAVYAYVYGVMNSAVVRAFATSLLWAGAILAGTYIVGSLIAHAILAMQRRVAF